MGLLSPMVFLCFPISTWLETFETLTQQADLWQEAGTGRTYPGGGRGAKSESIKECVKIKSHNCWYHSADCSRLKFQNFLLLLHLCTTVGYHRWNYATVQEPPGEAGEAVSNGSNGSDPRRQPFCNLAQFGTPDSPRLSVKIPWLPWHFVTSRNQAVKFRKASPIIINQDIQLLNCWWIQWAQWPSGPVGPLPLTH